MTLNLDKLAAESAQAMVNAAPGTGAADAYPTLERLSTKALGVMQEQGVYALMLFLFSRSKNEQKMALTIRQQLYKALTKIPIFSPDGELPSLVVNDKPEEVLRYYTESVLNDLDILLLVRDLYEQVLIYVRYGAKASGG